MSSRWQFSVSEYLDKGSRSYMEDFVCNHIEVVNGKVLFGIFGIFDGHGGSDAAYYVKKRLVDELKRNDKFWSSEDSVVVSCVKEVYSRLQSLMWIEREKWPQTVTGYKSTAGTTATIAIIRNGTIYVGHVGDSGMILAGCDDNGCLTTEELTKEHKPNDIEERKRIEKGGGSLKRKAGILRIVWNRRKLSSKHEIEQIPFLAVARSLGDLWSYDTSSNCYHVSPEPDVSVIKLDRGKHRALIIGSDGVWNVVGGSTSVNILGACYNISQQRHSGGVQETSLSLCNPAELLVKYSLFQWNRRKMRPDNVSAIVVVLVPEGDSTTPLSSLSTESNHQIDLIQSEILKNDLAPRYCTNHRLETLENSNDFQKYAPVTVAATDELQEERELLKLFILSSEKLSRLSLAWLADDGYWTALQSSLAVRGLPDFVCHFEGTAQSLEELLTAFSWAFVCLQALETDTRDGLLRPLCKQPLLSPFWCSFYTQVVSPNLCFSVDQLTQPSIYHMIMAHILQHRTADIISLIDVYSKQKAITTTTTTTQKFTLQKSQSYSIGRTLTNHNVYACIQLKRSSSLETGKFNRLASLLPTAASFNSGSDTPPMSPSICDSSSSVHPDPADSHRHHNLVTRHLLVRKRTKQQQQQQQQPHLLQRTKKSASKCCKRISTMSERKLVRFVARKKSRSS